MGNVYIIDFTTMQQVYPPPHSTLLTLSTPSQINEDTGTSRMIHKTNIDPSHIEEGSEVTSQDARLSAVREEPSLGRGFVGALFGPLYEVFDSTVSVRVSVSHCCVSLCLSLLCVSLSLIAVCLSVSHCCVSIGWSCRAYQVP